MNATPPQKINCISADAAATLKAYFHMFDPSVVFWGDQNAITAIAFSTPGWSYKIYHCPDGWELHPPNYSPRYVQLVEQLMKAILEINHEHQ